MRSYREAAIECSRAVLEQGGPSIRDARFKVRFFLAFCQRVAFKKRNHFFENSHVTRGLDELNYGVRKPKQIVGHPRANSAPRRRMPPVLDVAFDKLPRGRKQQLIASHASFRYT